MGKFTDEFHSADGPESWEQSDIRDYVEELLVKDEGIWQARRNGRSTAAKEGSRNQTLEALMQLLLDWAQRSWPSVAQDNAKPEFDDRTRTEMRRI